MSGSSSWYLMMVLNILFQIANKVIDLQVFFHFLPPRLPNLPKSICLSIILQRVAIAFLIYLSLIEPFS